MKSVFVYDKKKYFFIFLKKKLSNKYKFMKLNDVELMTVQDYDKDDIGIFIANNVNDVVAFFKFRECFNDRILLCTEKPIICEKYKKTFKISCLDISRTKKYFYKGLKENIDFLFNSESE